MAKNIKAERASIFMGVIELSVYQIPNGRYVLSGRNVTDAVKEEHKSLTRFYGVRYLKDLPSAGLEWVKNEGVNESKGLPSAGLEWGKINPGKEGSPFEPVSIQDATMYWHGMSKKGNPIADAITQAALIESIERRADAAFGIQRTEEERNQRFKARMDGIETRKEMCDFVKEYIDSHPDLSENAVKFMYSNVTDGIYRSLFGRNKKKLTEDLKANPDRLRDALNSIELNHLNAFEGMVQRLIETKDLEPLEAVKQAEERLPIKKIDRVVA